VAAQAGAGVKPGNRRVLFLRHQWFPDVYVHLVEDNLELVDEGYVDAAVDVLDELCRLGDARRGDGTVLMTMVS
jgi:hypothetical protein